MKHYFVSYRWYSDGENGFGRCVVNREGPICSIQDIADIEKAIVASDRGVLPADARVVIINWQPFEQPEAT